MKIKVISGGQTDADITGVKMPKGFRTESGNKLEYAELYNMTESTSRS